jgi:hypothetical protein
MAKKETPEEQFDTVFDVMPGAERDTEEVAAVDMNFGLGEEPVQEEEEPEEEVAAETEEEPVAEVEEPEAEEESEEPVAEVEEAEEPVAEAEPEPEPEKKDHMVPKSRLDEVLQKQKALQKQLEDMKKAQQPAENAPDPYDFDSKEKEYMNLVLDGKEADAVRLRQEIRTAEKASLQFEMTEQMQQTVQHNAQATALQAAANELEANFPVFDQNSESYNESYTQEVIGLRDAFIMQGFDAVDALSKAANFVLTTNNLVAPEPTTSTLDAPAAPKQKAVDEVAKKRAEVSKKLKAAEAQPPELPGESSAARGEKAVDVSTMSEDEFNALPEATIKRLRGDIL